MSGRGILSLGNLLMDVVTTVPPEFLEKHDLKPDSTTLAENHHLPIFDEIQGSKYSPQYFPGGCAANTVRVAQTSKATTFVGAVGTDKDSQKLVKLLQDEGVSVVCQNIENTPTGRCAVLITGQHRTLLTQLGASIKFRYEEFLNNLDSIKLEDFNVVYISGYFLRVCMQTVRKIIEIANANCIPVVLNLNAVWVAENFAAEIQDLLPSVNTIMGNYLEIAALSKILFHKDATEGNADSSDISTCMKLISTYSRNYSGMRTVVVTRGPNSVLVTNGNDEISEFGVLEVPKDKIIDTNGAGDAFAGGFIAGLSKPKGLKDCIKCGLWAAAEVIQNAGCNFNKEKTLDEL